MDWWWVLLAVFSLALVVWGPITDWRVRSARSFLLVGLALLVLATGISTLDLPPVAAIALAFGVMTPIYFKHPAVMPLGAEDARVSREVDRLHRALIRASDAYRRRDVTPPQLRSRFEKVRRQLRRIEPPDDEWRRLLQLMATDVTAMISFLDGSERDSADALFERRQRIRSEYSALIKRRTRFWR